MAAGAVTVPRDRLQHTEEPSSKNQSEKSSSDAPILITMDLLGASSSRVGSSNLKRCRSPVPFCFKNRAYQSRGLQDNNFPSFSLSSSANLCREGGGGGFRLDLGVFSKRHFESVCTLDKVKSALDRARRESQLHPEPSKACKEGEGEEEEEEAKGSPAVAGTTSFAAACPSCLTYVLTWKSHPVCPRCHAIVEEAPKKLRIDLNVTWLDGC